METFTTYKLPKLSKPELFVPPPYCRKAQRHDEEKEEILLSLNLIASNPSKLLLLHETLTDDSSKALEVKINKYLMKEAKCKLTFLVHFLPTNGEAIVQTLGREELETSIHLPVSEDLVALFVHYENEVLKCDENLNPQLFALFKKIFDEVHCNIVSVPILKKENHYPCSPQNIQPVLLVCFVNSEKDENFLIRIANELFKYCLPILLNTMTAEEEARQKRQCQSLLAVVRKLIVNLEDINELLKTIMSEAKKITRAQKCSLFLINPDHIHLASKVFHPDRINTVRANVKKTKDHVIPDHVATTGQILNIQNVDEHPLINQNLSEFTGFKARNVLCFPVKNENEVIGAVQLCNKRGGSFNYFDEEIANTLSVYCGLSIMHSLKYTQVENFQIRNFLSDELMIYYVQISEEDAIRKMNCPLIHRYPDFDQFNFSPRTIVQIESVCFVLKMFEELGFFATFSIKKNVFTRFVMSVKEGCRDVPYHNWMHLFCTAHFAYLCLKNLQLVEKGYITHLEALAYFISCLCHDVDYRGTNNAFQQEPTNTLASLYSSSGSVMERHRLSQVLRILGSEGCNFLEVLNRQDYGLCLNLLKDLILSTDLATHCKYYRKQYIMVEEGYNRNNPEHRYIFSCLLVTCADLSDYTKDWKVTKDICGQLYEEFVTQGDLEMRFDNAHSIMQNSATIFLPSLQTDFLNQICLPMFKLLAEIFVSVKELVHKIKKNILYWEASKHVFQKAAEEGRPYVEVLTSEEFEKDVEDTIELLRKQK